MRSVIVTAMWLCSVALPVHGQERGSSTSPQDSLSVAYQQALLALRDSTVPVRSALSQFRRDLQFAGELTVINRAARLNEACAALQGSLEAAQPVFRPSRAASSRAREASRTFLEEMGTLERALDTHCLKGLPRDGSGDWADSLKAWGPFHTANLQRTLQAYDGAAAVFAQAVGIRLEPGRTGIVP